METKMSGTQGTLQTTTTHQTIDTIIKTPFETKPSKPYKETTPFSKFQKKWYINLQ